MGVNKVMYGSRTVIDLSGSTIAPDKMLEGIIGYNAAGEEVVGTHQCEKEIGNGAYVWAIYDTKEKWDYTTKSLSGSTFPNGYESTVYAGWTITDDGYFEVNPGTVSGDKYYLPESSTGKKSKTILREGKYSYINPYTVMTVKDAPATVKGDNLLGYISSNESGAYPLKGVQDNKYYIRISGSDANVTADQMLSGNVGYTSNGKVTGSIQRQAAQTITPSTTDQTISSGKYLSGVQTIKGDTNLIPENIKKDVSIFGVLGELESTGGANVAQGTITGAGAEAVTIDTGLNSISIFAFFNHSSPSASGITSALYLNGTVTGVGVSYSQYFKTVGYSVGTFTIDGGKITYTPKGNTAVTALMQDKKYTWIAIE
mgnify:CR=1 FL=1